MHVLYYMFNSYSHVYNHLISGRVCGSNFDTSGPFNLHGLTLIPAWISNYIHYKVWDEITFPFLNLNGATVEFNTG